MLLLLFPFLGLGWGFGDVCLLLCQRDKTGEGQEAFGSRVSHNPSYQTSVLGCASLLSSFFSLSVNY